MRAAYGVTARVAAGIIMAALAAGPRAHLEAPLKLRTLASNVS
jgi:hypothetical protein